MKSFFFYSAFVCISASLCSCDNDNKKLLQTLEGRWQVTSVSFSNAPSKPDSTATPNSVYLEFEACSDQRNNNVNENCELAYYENSQKTSFNYSVAAQGGGPKTLILRQKTIPDKQPDFERIAPFVIKDYTVT